MGSTNRLVEPPTCENGPFTLVKDSDGFNAQPYAITRIMQAHAPPGKFSCVFIERIVRENFA